MTLELSGKSAVDVQALRYTFAGREQPSLSDISFSLAPGSWTLLAGRTGSGKSTLLRALAGLIPNQAAGEMGGSVHLFGLDTRGASPASLARAAGLVLQSPDDQMCTTTVESEVAFGLANLGLPPAEIDRRIAHWLDELGLSACRHQATQTLSGGQKQRLMLASILAMGPRLLLLDEPLAQLDYRAATELLDVLDTLRQAGLTLVVAEHRLDRLLTQVDRVLVLGCGRLLAVHAAGDPGLPSSLATAGLVADLSPLAPSSRAPRTRIEPPVVIVRAAQLAHRFPRQSRPLWENVNFEIAAGERACLLGENGCGKSTLLHALAGLMRPTSGEVTLAAAPAGSLPLGLVPQNPDLTLFCRTVYEELAFGPRQLGLPQADVRARVQHVARSMAIDDLLEESPQALSQGQRLRVAVAAALALRPRLLLLDEPTTGQDASEVRRLLGEIAAAVAADEAGALLFSTHDVRIAAQFATRVLVLADGRVVADAPVSDLLNDAELLAQARLGPAPQETPEAAAPPTTTTAANASARRTTS
jgi:energy-coupling factor transport system ATP-binding protein